MKRLFLVLGVLILACGAGILLPGGSSAINAKEPPPAQQQIPNPPNPPQPQAAPPPANQVQAPNQRAVEPPKIAEPVAFTTKDGKMKGWKVVIPGHRALATPAVADGKVYIGGGFGSHEFYAFDALTGKKIWHYQTKDDGPTAAVVQDGYIAFNTESCELEILALDGKPVWKKYLGDPLMSMPAIANGKVYMAYPNSKGDHKYYLACFDIKTGKEEWKKDIAGEIITAPVIDKDQVFLVTVEGTLYCFNTDGDLAWKEKKNATSSPMVWNGNCYFSRREEITVKKEGKDVKQQTEQVAARGNNAKDTTRDFKETTRDADYLDYRKRALSGKEVANQAADAGVGFGGGASVAKGAFLPRVAAENIAQASVAGIWAYQGSRPFMHNGQLFSAMGDTLQCVDPKTEKVLWKKNLHSKKETDKVPVLDSALTPPAIVNDKIFLGTTAGEVLCLSVKTGEMLWKAEVGEPIDFQPAIVNGRVFVSTSKGSLISLETGDTQDPGGNMWGGNAAHNGNVK
ncbi:MAG TPA: PQQ-binding-like beta-propeller repeat protein [Gemmataceae bacterium]|nr:PQQ-binding-like beta-propeller repeat protein [Gemmataceae bacterium]